MRLVLGAMLAALLVVGSAGASSTKRAPCFPAHSKTLVTTSDARVYRRLNQQFVCWYRTGKSFELARATGLDGAVYDHAPYRIAGRYLAYPVDYVDSNQRLLPELFVIDLRTGRPKYRSTAWEVDGFGDPSIGSTKVTRLFVLRDGSAAWMSENTDFQGALAREVRRVDPRGQQRLDRSGDVEAGSLALAGHTLTWRRGGEAHTADLR